MSWRDALRPVRMQRIAMVAPTRRLREMLVVLAGCGLAELDLPPIAEGAEAASTPATVLARAGRQDHPEGLDGAPLTTESRLALERAVPRILERTPRIDDLEDGGRWDLVAGELELRRVAAHAVIHRGAAVLVGWTPRMHLDGLAERLAAAGTSVVRLAHPARASAPTLISGTRVGRPFRPLVDTYGIVPYANIDPTLFTAFSYVLMFGMMFGDVGHGLILAGLGLYLRRTRRPALISLRGVWPVIVAAGLMGAAFGVLYGEVFGPTVILTPLWLAPAEDPITLLVAGILVGVALLSVSYLIGIANRWREGGISHALYAPSGIAGLCLFAGVGGAAAGLLLAEGTILMAGVAGIGLGLTLLFIGYLAAAGGGVTGAAEAVVELVDGVVRIASNTVSFARLAAFGLTHAAIGAVVWTATVGLADGGALGMIAAAIVFIVGNAVAFGLEALVAAVQALRLEYYELFSRIFSGEGRVFRPWQLPIVDKEAT